jgi:hypothetical protein
LIAVSLVLGLLCAAAGLLLSRAVFKAQSD